MTDHTPKKPNGHGGNIADFPDTKERRKVWAEKEKNSRPPTPPPEPALNLPGVVKILILLLVSIHLIMQLLPEGIPNVVFFYMSFIPGMYQTPFDFLPQILITPLTHTLLHGSWFHLLINIGMLTAFGSAIAKFTGARRFLILFAMASVFGALTHLFFFWGSANPLIGASGGISGLFGALLRILQDRGHMQAGWRGLMPITLLWIGISVLFAMLATVPGDAGEIAWTAHIGGFLSGMVLYPWIQRKF